MLSTGRKLHTPDGKVIERVVKRVINKAPHTKSYFHGNACGKYDHIIEFRNPTAKVARYLLNSIRRSMIQELPRGRKLSTSVVLGTEVGPISGSFSPDEDYEKPIRLYSFLRAHGNQLHQFVELTTKLNAHAGSYFGLDELKLRLIWTDSAFCVMTLSAYDVKNALIMVRHFVEKAKNIESSTVASLRYGREDVIKNFKLPDLYGIIFAKLRTLTPLRINHQTDFFSFAANLGLQPLSLGDYDRCLLTKKPTLAEIMEVSRKLKGDNPQRLLHTATILLSKG